MNRVLIDNTCIFSNGRFFLAKVWTDGSKTFGAFASSNGCCTIFDGEALSFVAKEDVYRYCSNAGCGSEWYEDLDTSDPTDYISAVYNRFLGLVLGGIE